MRLARKFVLATTAVLGMVAIPITVASATPAVNGHATFFTTADAGQGPGPIFLRGSVLRGICTDNQGDNVDHVVCPRGTFDIDHTNNTANQGTFTFNPVTCVGTFRITGTPFHFLNGTGAYAGLSGSGTANVRSSQIAPRLPSGACNPDQNATPVAGFTFIQASFSASLPS